MRLKAFACTGVSVALLLAAGCSVKESQNSSVGAAANWQAYNGDADETAYSRLDQVSASTVDRLGLAWSMDLPEISLAATPLAIDGILYFTGSQAAVYAVDGVSGKLLWKYDPESWKFNTKKMRYQLGVNRGLAYGDGRIYVGVRDGRLIALNPKDGSVIWSTETLDRDSAATISGAPRFFKGKVIIGAGGADSGVRSSVVAVNAANGKLAWRFYTTPGTPEENRGDPAMEMAAKTWKGEYWKSGTGGDAWHGITFDAEMNRIYVGTGNASPNKSEVPKPGGGDNLFTASVVALDADTGKYLWHYQETPGDVWDFDSTMQMTLAALEIDGKSRKVLMHAPKNGFFYVIDRATGRLISAEKYGKVT